MQITSVVSRVCAVLLCACTTAPQALKSQAANLATTTPLVLEKNEGERRVMRGWPEHPDPGEAFILKVDPKNGGSSRLVFFTADLAPGGVIEAHKHPNADEILFLQTGSARVHLGDSVRVVHAGATVFIPAKTWIAVENIGNDVISLECVFSAPGFEDVMRDASVREGEKNVPMSKAEDTEFGKKHLHDVIYKQP
jgi:quercetin dioxygenase-like cupin family protein